MKTLIATATKHDIDGFKNTRLSKSLTYHKENQSVVNYELEPTFNNTTGLCSVYNNYLTKKYLKKYDCILFVHDDLHIDSVNFLTCIREYFKKGYDVVGLAGGSKIQIKKPCLWHILCKPETLSGVVAHYKNKTDYYQTIFGQVPKEVVLLDGLFLAVKTKSLALHNIRFDENIKGFHHYDLKFCLDCHLAGMRLTTAPIQVIHDSPGLTKFTEEFAKSEEYLYNVLVKHADQRK
tara:strand:- start:4413 stop:5117 length:705 start_codon:yes stop_codon:yes gene_type:complete